MEIKAVKFRKDGFYGQPFAFGGEEGMDKFDPNVRYRGSLHRSPGLPSIPSVWKPFIRKPPCMAGIFPLRIPGRWKTRSPVRRPE